jgi:tripartite ATP-independent transporter DctM subunit
MTGYFEVSHVLALSICFAALLMLGVPISVCIGLSALAALLLSLDPSIATTVIAQRMATGLDSFTLLAIPFFILAGQLMNHGGVARRLVDFAKVLVAPLPGGLAFVNVLGCMLFGAVSGSAAAAAAAIGGLMGPMMDKEGYDRNYSAAVNISSATTGLLIPPSNSLIVYSLASGGVSIAALFLAGYVPGLLLGGSLMVTAGIMAYRRGYAKGKGYPPGEGLKRFLGAIPSLLMLVIVIGGIILGLFTATEASAVAVFYSLVLSVGIYREIKPSQIPRILLAASTTTAIVMFLIATSMSMSWVLSYENIPRYLANALLSITDNSILILLAINLLLLIVGTFMDLTPAVLIFTPILLPVVVQMGIDPIHFGIIMILNLCIGLCTPPVGSVLFVGCSVSGTRIADVIRPLLVLYLAMILSLILVIQVPGLSLALPRLLGF